ncbi:uncharacterized protein DFE_2973 [Desulfovibrio ferrophilus]|uniref:DUF6946 domain-containing protein n=1 Tax=Desulfovibrio ferrophilus TaxID=241368 RepID=A0A2Z6B2F4_9BACT|nr:uncharacterized protein DFE_2973 [Desulfovibrio ferrophilus]
MARTDNGLVVIMVEGKASESFGPTLGEWRQQSSNGRQTRLAYLQQTLGLNRDLPDSLRYQLLHRTASPIIIARRYHAVAAVMLVHSFSKTNEWFSDYATFLNLYGIKTDIGELHEIMVGSPLRVFCGWAKGIPAI